MLKNDDIDLISGNPKKAIKTLAMPTIIALLVIMVDNLIDSMWVVGLGSDALAAIGFMIPLVWFISGISSGISVATTSIISRAIGANDEVIVNNAALHIVLITFLVSIIMSVVSIICLKPALELMGAGSALAPALDYGYIQSVFIIVFMFNLVLAALFRSEGKVKLVSIILVGRSILHLILDPILIYTLNMGIAGASWATVVSFLISLSILLYLLFIKKDTIFKFSLSSFKTDKSILKDIASVAIPNSSENIILSVFNASINTLLASLSSIAVVAAYTSAMRIVALFIIPLEGIGSAMLIIVGVAYGAKKYDKMEYIFKYCIKITLIISILMTVFLFVFAPYISILFNINSDGSLIDILTPILQILSLYILVMFLGILSTIVFQAVGKGTTSFLLILLKTLVFELIFMVLLGVVFGLAEVGIFAGVVIGALLGSIVSYLVCMNFIKKLKVNNVF